MAIQKHLFAHLPGQVGPQGLHPGDEIPAGLPGLEPLPLLAEQGLRLPDLPLQLLGGWDGKPVDVIQRHMGKPRHPRVHIPGNGEVQKQHVVVQSTRFQLLGPDGDVGPDPPKVRPIRC